MPIDWIVMFAPKIFQKSVGLLGNSDGNWSCLLFAELGST